MPPRESPVVNQREVEPGGRASSSFGVASGQCRRAPALRACRAAFTERRNRTPTPTPRPARSRRPGRTSACRPRGRQRARDCFRPAVATGNAAGTDPGPPGPATVTAANDNAAFRWSSLGLHDRHQLWPLSIPLPQSVLLFFNHISGFATFHSPVRCADCDINTLT